MAKFIIEGKQNLSGSIEVYGAKNAAIKMIAGSVLLEGKTTLKNVPDILDIKKIINILEKMGATCQRHNHEIQIDTKSLISQDPDPKLVGAIRASIVLVGPLLSRFGRVRIPHPGGCTIGSRPINLHIKAFQDLGVKVTENNKFYEFISSNDKIPQKSTITLEKISVTATENIILFGCREEGKVFIIQNAAIEPEIIDLIDFLKSAGADISVKDRTIIITGKKTLKSVTYSVIPDRIEAGTFAILAATTGNELRITNVNLYHLGSLLKKLERMGVEVVKGKDFLYIKKPSEILATDIVTAEYPGFPTDLQPPMGILLTQSKGKSFLHENIFEHRLEYLKELEKMGADVKFINSCEVEITGPTPLKGAKIESLDLRAGATLLIAGLTADGITEIKNAENIDRGYEKIEVRLQKIGAKIKRVI